MLGLPSDATPVAAEPGNSRRWRPRRIGMQRMEEEYRAAWLPLETDEAGASVIEGACARCVAERKWWRQAGERQQRPKPGNHAKSADPWIDADRAVTSAAL